LLARRRFSLRPLIADQSRGSIARINRADQLPGSIALQPFDHQHVELE
jgi:hypothetical protein